MFWFLYFYMSLYFVLIVLHTRAPEPCQDSAFYRSHYCTVEYSSHFYKDIKKASTKEWHMTNGFDFMKIGFETFRVMFSDQIYVDSH